MFATVFHVSHAGRRTQDLFSFSTLSRPLGRGHLITIVSLIGADPGSHPVTSGIQMEYLKYLFFVFSMTSEAKFLSTSFETN